MTATPKELAVETGVQMHELGVKAGRVLASFKWLHDAAWSPDRRGETIPETDEGKGLASALGPVRGNKTSNPTQDVAFDPTKRDQRRALDRAARRTAKILERTIADLASVDYALRQSLSDSKDPVPSFIPGARPASHADIREAVEAKARRGNRGEGFGSG